MPSQSALNELFARLHSAKTRGYAICTAPRSGSNFLCQLLTSTGKLGAPLEYFNGHSRRIFEDPDYPDDRKAQIAKILAIGSTPNRVYALKMFHYHHLEVSAQMDWPAKLPRLRYVYLRRNDLIGQAISWSRARQTGQYRASQPALSDPQYDPAQILECLKYIRHEYAGWDAYFADRDITPLTLVYEDIVENPHNAIRSIADLMGERSHVRADLLRVSVEVQSDATTLQWRQRLMDDVPKAELSIM